MEIIRIILFGTLAVAVLWFLRKSLASGVMKSKRYGRVYAARKGSFSQVLQFWVIITGEAAFVVWIVAHLLGDFLRR